MKDKNNVDTKAEAPSSLKDETSKSNAINSRQLSQSNDLDASLFANGTEVFSVFSDAEMTDRGNAKRLVAAANGNIRYVGKSKTYIVWNGRYWQEEKTVSLQLAIYAMDMLLRIARRFGRDELEEFAKSSQSRGRLKAAADLSKYEPGITIDPSLLDRDIYLFNVQNGTVNLRTGELQPHNKEDYITKISPVFYNSQATCPRFDQFINEIMLGRTGMIYFLQRVAGYLLTGSIKEQCLFFLLGNGHNGKSKLLDVLCELYGDYVMRTGSSTLMKGLRGAGSASPDLARLKGARVVRASELDHGDTFSESLIKDMTGGEKIICRRLYAEHEEYDPLFKIILAGNHKPKILGSDFGIWRRFKLVPFELLITDDQKDPDLVEKLFVELSGIFNWAIAGCLEWQQVGLNPPDEVVSAVAEYRNESSPFEFWLEEECKIDDDASTKFADLYKSYESWAIAQGEKPVSRKALGGFLGGRFKKQNSNARAYSGIALRRPDSRSTIRR